MTNKKKKKKKTPWKDCRILNNTIPVKNYLQIHFNCMSKYHYDFYSYFLYKIGLKHTATKDR